MFFISVLVSISNQQRFLQEWRYAQPSHFIQVVFRKIQLTWIVQINFLLCFQYISVFFFKSNQVWRL
ncbi:hypothetical protein DAI22_11g084100 [Oryza sativa Japonica Group]|nr:hypothetical protein DAI22_11g084100 [Oryza sativa Japonica Group]